MQVFGYGRASTDKQALTLESQAAIVATAYSNRSWPDDTTYKWCADAAVSSKEKFLQRPAGSVIASKAQRGDVLMVASYDRLWRSLRDFIDTLDWIQQSGLDLIILDFGSQVVDSRTPMGKAMLSIMAVIKQLERDEISRRTKAVLDVLRDKQHTGQRRHIGYCAARIRLLDALEAEADRWIAVPHPAERVFGEWLASHEGDPEDIAAQHKYTSVKWKNPVTGGNISWTRDIAPLVRHARAGWPLYEKPYSMPSCPFQILEWKHLGPNVECGRLRLTPATPGMPSWTAVPSLAKLVLRLERETFPDSPDRPLVALAAGEGWKPRQTS